MRFKTYSFCLGIYFYDFLFAFRVIKINKLKKKPKLIDLSAIIYCLYKSLLATQGYVVFIDKLFINVKLFTVLWVVRIYIFRITKVGSNFLVELFEIWELSTKKNNWGIKTYTIVFKDIQYLV